MTPEVFAAHLLAALPLAGVLGLKFVGRPVVWAVVGLVTVVVGWAAWTPLGGLLDDLSAGLPTRCVLRTGLLVVAFAPWAAVAAGLVRSAVRPRPTPTALLVAVVAAVAVPAVAADRAATAGVADVQRELGRGRLVQAAAALDRVTDLTAARTLPFRGRPTPVEQVRAELARITDQLTAGMMRPPAASATRAELEGRADVLLALGRPAEVGPLLRAYLADVPSSRLKVAEAGADLGDWPASAEHARMAAEALRAAAGRDPKAAAVRRQALNLLADALAVQDDRAAVEAVLRDGADTLPAFAGHFRLRLGDFYRTTGRPLAALAELREAVRLDPALATAASRTGRAVRDTTPGCLVGR